MTNKMFTAANIKEYSDDEMSIVCYASTEDVDRDNEVILLSAWDDESLSEYRLNPLILLNHDPVRHLPIGKSLWQKVDNNGLKFKVQFAKTDLGKEVYSLFKDRILTSFSVGFISKKGYDNSKVKKYIAKDGSAPDYVHEKVSLLELSVVSLPANPMARVVYDEKAYNVKSFIDCNKKGLLKSQELCDIACQLEKDIESLAIDEEINDGIEEIVDELKSTEPEDKENNGSEDKENNSEIIEKIEVTEDYIHIPVKDAGMFEDGHFRTIDISKSEGIKAVIGRLKGETNTTVQKYIFDKEKWTRSEAVKWVNDHKKSFIIEIEKEQENSTEEKSENKKEFLHTICKSFMPTKKDIETNKELFKSFDVTEIPSIPLTFNYDVFSKFLEVDVKEINRAPYFIPNIVKGVELAGFDEVCKDFELHSERNFNSNGSESPITYEKIQLDSKKTREFLVEGTRFYKTEAGNCIISYDTGWGGIYVDIFTSRKKSFVSNEIFKNVDQWVEANNFLKGEKMSITGKFLGNYDTTWDDIFVDEKYKGLLKRTVNKNSVDKGSRGFLLIGPPGTGKTLTGKAIMNDSEDTFIWASSDDFKSMGAVRGMSLAFDMARKLAPTTIFVEDIDTWLDYYTIDLLKTEMDGLKNNNGVVTILTSNRPEKFPEALIDRPGRFHHVFNFALPDENMRKQMLTAWTKGVDEEKIDEFVTMTKGFSGAHIKELVDYAKILMEDEEIEFGDALVKSLKNIVEQRELISSIKEGRQSKSTDAEEIFEIEEIKTKFLENVEETFEIEDELFEIEEKSLEIEKENKEEGFEIDFDEFIEKELEEAKKIAEAKLTGKLY